MTGLETDHRSSLSQSLRTTCVKWNIPCCLVNPGPMAIVGEVGKRLTWTTCMSSVLSRRVMTAAVTVEISSGSNGPPRVLMRLFASWTASAGRCSLSLVVRDARMAAKRGDRVTTNACTTGGSDDEAMTS